MKNALILFFCIASLTVMAQPRMQTPGFFDTNVVISAAPPTNAPSQENSAAKIPSGFYGQTVEVRGVTASERAASEAPVKRDVLVFDGTGKLVCRIATNPVGQFYSFVNYGNYTLVAVKTGEQFTSVNLANLPQNQAANPVKITVTANRLTKADIQLPAEGL